MPSSAANTPHGCGWIHTCTIGLASPVRTPLAQLPLASMIPTTFGAPFSSTDQQRLSCLCHVMSGPAQSVSDGSSAGRALAMYIAPASVR